MSAARPGYTEREVTLTEALDWARSRDIAKDRYPDPHVTRFTDGSEVEVRVVPWGCGTIDLEINIRELR